MFFKNDFFSPSFLIFSVVTLTQKRNILIKSAKYGKLGVIITIQEDLDWMTLKTGVIEKELNLIVQRASAYV